MLSDFKGQVVANEIKLEAHSSAAKCEKSSGISEIL